MGNVVIDVSMSIDGFVAGPDDSEEVSQSLHVTHLRYRRRPA
jgi:hypothetical protein